MAPVDNSPAVNNSCSFRLLCSLKANDLIPVHKYKSSLTGLTVVLAEVEGPVVNGYFCLGKCVAWLGKLQWVNSNWFILDILWLFKC